MSIHFLCSIGIKFQLLVDDGFNIGLAFAAGSPGTLSSCVEDGAVDMTVLNDTA